MNENDISSLLKDISLTLTSINARLIRVETRLSKLMVFQGMQTDGRQEITTDKFKEEKKR